MEPEATVEFQVEDVAAFEVADAVFHIGLRRSILNHHHHNHQYNNKFPSLQRGKKQQDFSMFSFDSNQELEEFTYLLGGIFDQTFRIPFAPRARFRADVDEVPGVDVVVFAEDVVFGVVQQGQELVEEALFALLGEFPVEADHAAPEHGAEVVHVFVRGHPVSRGFR